MNGDRGNWWTEGKLAISLYAKFMMTLLHSEFRIKKFLMSDYWEVLNVKNYFL